MELHDQEKGLIFFILFISEPYLLTIHVILVYICPIYNDNSRKSLNNIPWLTQLSA